MVPFSTPHTGVELQRRGSDLVDPTTSHVVGRIDDGIHRFVPARDSYAESFGVQWNRWENELSDSRNAESGGEKRQLLLDRTRFGEFDLEGKTILECGCGGGDDTEVLLGLPFSEVHSFDLSHGVVRARKFLKTDRLVLSQADIFDIPYADGSFDFVFCHRVVQHTPDPAQALRSVARKVKPGGVLFVHSYHRSWFFMSGYKYKYRWLTRRLPAKTVSDFLDVTGPALFRLNTRIAKSNSLVKFLGHSLVPLERLPLVDGMAENVALERAKLCTFDALTPAFDQPMTWPTMKRIVESEGFEIRYHESRPTYPLWCTSVRVS